LHFECAVRVSAPFLFSLDLCSGLRSARRVSVPASGSYAPVRSGSEFRLVQGTESIYSSFLIRVSVSLRRPKSQDLIFRSAVRSPTLLARDFSYPHFSRVQIRARSESPAQDSFLPSPVLCVSAARPGLHFSIEPSSKLARRGPRSVRSLQLPPEFPSAVGSCRL
jgi:hypothetical protein